MRKYEIWFFICFKTFLISHVNLKSFEFFSSVLLFQDLAEFCIFSVGGWVPHRDCIPGPCMLWDPSRNRLASLALSAYFAINPTRFFAKANKMLTTVKCIIDHNYPSLMAEFTREVKLGWKLTLYVTSSLSLPISETQICLHIHHINMT